MHKKTLKGVSKARKYPYDKYFSDANASNKRGKYMKMGWLFYAKKCREPEMESTRINPWKIKHTKFTEIGSLPG